MVFLLAFYGFSIKHGMEDGFLMSIELGISTQIRAPQYPEKAWKSKKQWALMLRERNASGMRLNEMLRPQRQWHPESESKAEKRSLGT